MSKATPALCERNVGPSTDTIYDESGLRVISFVYPKCGEPATRYVSWPTITGGYYACANHAAWWAERTRGAVVKVVAL